MADNFNSGEVPVKSGGGMSEEVQNNNADTETDGPIEKILNEPLVKTAESSPQRNCEDTKNVDSEQTQKKMIVKYKRTRCSTQENRADFIEVAVMDGEDDSMYPELLLGPGICYRKQIIVEEIKENAEDEIQKSPPKGILCSHTREDQTASPFSSVLSPTALSSPLATQNPSPTPSNSSTSSTWSYISGSTKRKRKSYQEKLLDDFFKKKIEIIREKEAEKQKRHEDKMAKLDEMIHTLENFLNNMVNR